MSYILVIVLLSGQIVQQKYLTEDSCENALVAVTVSGQYKHIEEIECVKVKQ